MAFVEECWADAQVEGWKGYVIKEKFKILKEKLRKWNKEVFGVVDLNIANTADELNQLDKIVADGGDINLDQRKLLTAQFWKQLNDNESLLTQKSRSKWIVEGDANTKYFHACLKARRRRNQMIALKVGDKWLETVLEVKNEVRRFFQG